MIIYMNDYTAWFYFECACKAEWMHRTLWHKGHATSWCPVCGTETISRLQGSDRVYLHDTDAPTDRGSVEFEEWMRNAYAAPTQGNPAAASEQKTATPEPKAAAPERPAAANPRPPRNSKNEREERKLVAASVRKWADAAPDGPHKYCVIADYVTRDIGECRSRAIAGAVASMVRSGALLCTRVGKSSSFRVTEKWRNRTSDHGQYDMTDARTTHDPAFASQSDVMSAVLEWAKGAEGKWYTMDNIRAHVRSVVGQHRDSDVTGSVGKMVSTGRLASIGASKTKKFAVPQG